MNKNNAKMLEWGNDCKAWFLLDKENMCVIHEEMPPNSSEQCHYHQLSEQFFYVLSGTLGVMMNGETHYLNPGESIFVTKETAHNVFNDSDSNVDFLLFSAPNPSKDRINVSEN